MAVQINILTDRLPKGIIIGGAEYPINFDFRTSIRFEIMLRDNSISDEIKIMRMMEMYFKHMPFDVTQAVKGILWFYNGGRYNDYCGEVEHKDKHNARRKDSTIKYSFIEDAPYIYAAFREQYGINLQRIEDDALHWWEFIALFDALREDTKMGQIMYYRTVSTSGMPNAKRRAINELKKKYAIKDEVSCDMKVALTKRNADWKGYVKKRIGDMDA